MRQFISFIRKEFYHIMRDKRTVLILLGIPVMQIILFGFAISTEVKNVRFTVYDPSNDVLTHKIIDRFAANEYFTLTENLLSISDVEKLFKEDKIDLVIVFESRFDESMYHNGKASIQLIVDGTDPNAATLILGYANSIIASCQQEITAGAASPYAIIPEVKLLYNPHMKSAYNFVPGVMGLIFMIICAMMTSISIVREKEQGTMELLLASPIKPLFIIFAKAIPYLVLSAVNLTTILALSVFLLQVPVSGSIFWLIIISMIFISVALSLGLLISSLVRTQIAAILVSGIGLMMPTIVISGMIFPVENMPELLQWISTIVPVRWYIDAVKKLMIEGLEIKFALKELSILFAMAVILLTVSFKKFKYRLE
ncbi:MAG: ABC transporter permease [Prevotellaceae bacterium]|jgi:ABC-2 type transport system permease protein|nr:ABC transporter permease [Prevotellaceae bacterium]